MPYQSSLLFTGVTTGAAIICLLTLTPRLKCPLNVSFCLMNLAMRSRHQTCLLVKSISLNHSSNKAIKLSSFVAFILIVHSMRIMCMSKLIVSQSKTTLFVHSSLDMYQFSRTNDFQYCSFLPFFSWVIPFPKDVSRAAALFAMGHPSPLHSRMVI